MAQINHELWRVVAAGHLTEWRDKLLAMTDINHRRLMVKEGHIHGYIAVRIYLNMGIIVTPQILNAMSSYIKNQEYAPEIVCEPPIPTNARVVTGTTLAADNPGANRELHVYAWDGLTFEHKGALSEFSQPGKGVYVLAVHDSAGNPGLPSQYLTIA